jgi:hypothetical protein
MRGLPTRAGRGRPLTAWLTKRSMTYSMFISAFSTVCRRTGRGSCASSTPGVESIHNLITVSRCTHLSLFAVRITMVTPSSCTTGYGPATGKDNFGDGKGSSRKVFTRTESPGNTAPRCRTAFDMQQLIYPDAECVSFFGSGTKTLHPGQQLMTEHGFCDPIRLGVGRLCHRSSHGGRRGS